MNSTSFTVTAGALKAILCFINPKNTPKIAYDNDSLAVPLINKIEEMVGDKDGTEPIFCYFGKDEQEILSQFYGVCSLISRVFNSYSL